MLAVHFGAGNIGRGFIGQLLNESNYKICFVDINQQVIDDINSQKKYTIEFVGVNPKKIEVTNIFAVNIADEEKVIKNIIEANIITTALGPNALKYIVPIVAKGIIARVQVNQDELNIIACENMISASSALETLVYKNIPSNLINKIKQKISFPNAAVDRIVPIQHNEEKLLVKTEEFYEWDVDSKSVLGERPNVKGITYVDNLQAYIERKLFAVNATHASIAYLGNLYGEKTIYDASCNENVMKIVHEVATETGKLLVHKYHFDMINHQKYMKTILSRFANLYISDEISRVARSPIRKIGYNERLIAPARQLISLGLAVNGLVKVIVAAFLFVNEKDPEAVELQNFITKHGIKDTVIKYCGLKDNDVLTEKIEKEFNSIK